MWTFSLNPPNLLERARGSGRKVPLMRRTVINWRPIAVVYPRGLRPRTRRNWLTWLLLPDALIWPASRGETTGKRRGGWPQALLRKLFLSFFSTFFSIFKPVQSWEVWKCDGATRSATTEGQEESHSAVSHPVVNKFSGVNRCELIGYSI